MQRVCKDLLLAPFSKYLPGTGRSFCRGNLPALPLAIDQHRLLPPARRLVGTVDTSRPAARPLLPLQQFLTGSCNAALARRRLLRVIAPADELVPAKRRQALPQGKHFGIRSHGSLKVVTRFVDRTVEKGVCHETSRQILPITAQLDRRTTRCPRSHRLRPAV